MVVKRCSWGTCECDAGSRSQQKKMQFIHGVCSHWHVCPRIMGNNSPVFFPRTGLLVERQPRDPMDSMIRGLNPRQEHKKNL